MENVIIISAVVVVAGVLLWPRVAGSRLWRATTTPLASIIGSGFLVLGPLLDATYGAYAPAVMAALCLVAWVFGAAVRFNIVRRANGRTRAEDALDQVASFALAAAYIVSVAYYLNLLGSFAVSMTTTADEFHARLVTTAVFCLIGFVGWTQGFGALERMEQFSVGLKLAVIAGLLVGLAWFFAGRVAGGELMVNSATTTGWPAVAIGFGLIVTVQGFETSRYLGSSYDASMQVRSMRFAQGLSTLVYMIYIGLLAYLFVPETLELDETAIIDLMAIVAPILPVMLVGAALAAQFSAAVADTGGAGGLFAEVSHGRISQRMGYALLVGIGLALTWIASVFDIISYASRAFAIYYALQAGLAAWGAELNGKRGPACGFAVLAVLGLAIAAFGRSVE